MDSQRISSFQYHRSYCLDNSNISFDYNQNIEDGNTEYIVDCPKIVLVGIHILSLSCYNFFHRNKADT